MLIIVTPNKISGKPPDNSVTMPVPVGVAAIPAPRALNHANTGVYLII